MEASPFTRPRDPSLLIGEETDTIQPILVLTSLEGMYKLNSLQLE